MHDDDQRSTGARGMNDPVEPATSGWAGSRGSKQRNAVQRNVNALLDSLAPERTLTRADPAKHPIEQHRTPTGCVLQAPGAALSLSWFVGTNQSYGELNMVLWRGILSRRGAAARKEAAEVTREIALTPIEPPHDDRVWRAEDGTEYSTESLAAFCQELLEQQIAAG